MNWKCPSASRSEKCTLFGDSLLSARRLSARRMFFEVVCENGDGNRRCITKRKKWRKKDSTCDEGRWNG